MNLNLFSLNQSNGKMKEMDELKNIAPELSKLKKENPFGTPKNYFNDFSARLHTELEKEKAAPAEQKTRLIQLLKPALGLAASFALIFLLVYVPLKTFTPSEVTEVAENSEYSDSELINLLEKLDENSFFALLEESSDDQETFSDEDLMAYVSTNFTDYEIFEKIEN